MIAPLWISSARRRPVAALSLVMVTLLTTLAAALGPIMLRAVEQSALQQTLATAPPGSDDILLTLHSSDSVTVDEALDATREPADLAPDRLFGPMITLAESDTLNWQRSAASPSGRRVRVAADIAGCAQFAVTSGRCAESPTEVVVPDADVAARRTSIGAGIVVGGDHLPYRVVGTYDPDRSTALILTRADPLRAGIDPTTDDDLVMSIDGVQRLAVPTEVSARRPLRGDRVHMDDLATVRKTLAQVQRAALDGTHLVAVDSGLPARLAVADADRSAAQAVVLVLVVQALVVAWFSAIVVMAMVARVRAREWALGRLRGVRRSRWLLALFAEPLVLLAIGVGSGFGLAVVISDLATQRWLRTGTGIEPFRLPVLFVGGLAVLGLCSALVTASVRSARAPLASLLSEGAEPVRVTRFALIGQVLVLALAGASVYQLHASDNLVDASARLALLAPALLAAGLGVIAIGLVSRVVRARSRRPARSVIGLLLLRPLARVPSALQRNVAIAIVVALAVFGTQLAALSAHNQHRRADAVVGADQILVVRVPPTVNLLTAVRTADPGGTDAMAVLERESASDGGSSRVVAVDSSRLAAVMKWYPEWGSGLRAAELAARLHPARPDPLTLTGSRVDVRVGDVVNRVLAANPDGPTTPTPQLHLIVADTVRWQDLALGPLSDSGPSTYSAPTDICSVKCRIVHVYLDNSDDQSHTSYTAQFTLESIATDRQPAGALAAVLTDGRRWQPWASHEVEGADVGAKAIGTPSGLQVDATDELGDSQPGVSPADVPDPLPAMPSTGLTAGQVVGRPDARVGTGLDGQRQLITPIATPSFLPRALDDGVLVDLAYVSALSDPSAAQTQSEVWLRRGAPSGVLAALHKQGILILGRESIDTTRHTLSMAAAARGATTNLVLVAVSALIGLAVIAATQLVDADRRRTLWTVAHSSRIGRRRMTRLVLLEIGSPAVLGAVIGALAGVSAIGLAGARLPLFAAGSLGPPLDVGVRWTLAAAVTAVAVVVIVLVATVLAGVESRRDRRRT